MRERLSELMVESAKKDPNFIVLTGDHGYQLFDALRKECPKQFLNCGVTEQAMVGVAAGLARLGFKPVVYGLASFIPIRVLEQIKLDVCYSNLPVTFIGDGAGLVYSYLGASHQCAEDIAVLRPLPNISIYSPWDAESLERCWDHDCGGPPTYIRIGKADRPALKKPKKLSDRKDVCIVSHGSMASISQTIALKLKVPCLLVERIKPFISTRLELAQYERVIVIEEHGLVGGLYSMIREYGHTNVHPVTLIRKFSKTCGSYQHALSEHGMDDKSLMRRVKELIQ